MFHAVPEEPADLVERVVFVAAAAQRVLLHPPTDFIDYLSSEPDHMERVEDRHHVREAVLNRVGVAAERIQGGVVDAIDERLGLVLQPCLVHTSGAAHNRIEQSGVEASGLVTGQINHDGDGPIDPDSAGPPVGSARGAVTALPLFCFPGRPPNPPCDFHATGSPRKAAHLQADGLDGVHGVGMRYPR
jgi:hypothetical protein